MPGGRSSHDGEYRWHDDDCLCKLGGSEYCNRNGYVWSCCGQVERDAACGSAASRSSVPASAPAAASTGKHRRADRAFGWTGRLPGERRRRRSKFRLFGDELEIAGRPSGRDRVIPEREALSHFLDQQSDLLETVAPCVWRVRREALEEQLLARLDAAADA